MRYARKVIFAFIVSTISRREASPLGHEQAPAGCKNTKHEVRGIRGAKIGQMDSTCSIPGKKLETEYAKWKQRLFHNFHYGIEFMEIKWYIIFKRQERLFVVSEAGHLPDECLFGMSNCKTVIRGC